MLPDRHHYSSPILKLLALYHLDILFHSELSFAIWRGAIATMRNGKSTWYTVRDRHGLDLAKM
jgi:hypothetical protein